MSRKKLLIIILINLIFAVCFILLGYVHYETNDDEGFNLIASGGGASQHLFFINIVFGYILKIFYLFSSGINWYLWFILLLNFLGIIFLSLSLTRSLNSTSASVLVTIILNVTLGENIYNSLQFTKNAAFLMITGFTLLMSALFGKTDNTASSDRKYKIIFSITGFIFFSFGYMLRADVLNMLIPFFLLFVAAAVLRRIKYDREKLMSAVIEPLRYIIILSVVIAALWGVNYLAEHYTSDWKEYWKYQAARSNLRDKGTPDYESHKDEYAEIGWDETELTLFRFWITIDDKFSQENLDYIIRMKNSDAKIDSGIDSSFFEDFYEAFIKNRILDFSYPYIYIAIILGIILFTDIFGILNLILSALVLLFEHGYLVNLGRVVWRVEFGMWAAFLIINALYLLLFSNKFKACVINLMNKFFDHKEGAYPEDEAERKIIFENTIKRLFISLGILLLIERIMLLALDFKDIKGSHVVMDIENPCADFIEYTCNDDRIYYVDTMTFDTKTTNVFSITPDKYKGIGDKYIGMGGWMIPSPVWKENYAEHLPELIDLYEDDNIFFVDVNNTNMYILNLLKKDYNENVEVALVDFYEGIGVWKFYINEQPVGQ